MKILRKDIDQNLILDGSTNFSIDGGWDDSFSTYEEDLLEKIINPIENYETVRYLHEPYNSQLNITQTDIWFKFYFLSGSTYVLDYSPIGITPKNNSKMLKSTIGSFFRLEFYKTPNNDAPDRNNRRLVFTKNLSLPLGEKYFYTSQGVNDFIFKPVFMGSNYKNKENMYLFWFQDDTVLNETNITGDTFYMTARFFNSTDGSILDFVKSDLNTEVNESNDMYYKMVINKETYTYSIFKYNSTSTGDRIGLSGDPIIFYEKK